MPQARKSVESIKIGELRDASEVRLQLLYVIGGRPGNSLWILSGVHGDELNSTKIAIELFKRIDPEQLSGTLVIIPVANPTAFQRFSRFSPVDDLDLNGVYPGEPGGSLSQRTAKLILSRAAESATLILDLHSGGMYGDNHPYVIFQDKGPAADLGRRVAVNFGAEIIIRQAGGSIEPGSLGNHSADLGIPTVMGELGGGVRFQPDMVVLGLRGVMNTLITLGMIEGTVQGPEEQYIYSHRDWVTASRGGISSFIVEPGATIERGQLLGTIENLGGEIVEEVVTPFGGRLTLLRQFPAVRTGDWLALIADAQSMAVVRRE